MPPVVYVVSGLKIGTRLIFHDGEEFLLANSAAKATSIFMVFYEKNMNGTAKSEMWEAGIEFGAPNREAANRSSCIQLANGRSSLFKGTAPNET